MGHDANAEASGQAPFNDPVVWLCGPFLGPQGDAWIFTDQDISSELGVVCVRYDDKLPPYRELWELTKALIKARKGQKT